MRANIKGLHLVFMIFLIFGGIVPYSQAAPVNAPVTGEIDRIILNNPD